MTFLVFFLFSTFHVDSVRVFLSMAASSDDFMAFDININIITNDKLIIDECPDDSTPFHDWPAESPTYVALTLAGCLVQPYAYMRAQGRPRNPRDVSGLYQNAP